MNEPDHSVPWWRHLSLLGYALGALQRRRGRAFALMGGLASAVALIAAVLFLSDALRSEAERARDAAPDLTVQLLIGGRPTLMAPEQAQTLRAIPGVAHAKPRVWGYVFFPILQGNVTVVGTGQETYPDSNFSNTPFVLETGRAPLPSESGVCLLGHELAHLLGVRVGDQLTFPAPDDKGPTVRVVGIFHASVSLFTSDVALMNDADARRALGIPDNSVTDLAIDLTNPDESNVVARAITELVPHSRVLEKRLLNRVYALSYGRRAGFVLGATLPALLALLVLAWDRASGLGPAERREIAILKACGWSTADLIATKLYESILVSISGTTMGIVLGYAWVFWLGAPGLREVLAGWSVMYPKAPLTPALDGAQLLGLLTMVAGPFVALSVGPAWRAAMTDPMEAMRGGG